MDLAGGGGGGGVFSFITELLAVCSGKLLVFIQYNISVWLRSYSSPVNAFRCLVLPIRNQKLKRNGKNG